MKTQSAFTLRSGNKPSIAKIAGVSPLKNGKYPKGKPMVDKDSDGTPDYIQNPNPPKTKVKKDKSTTKKPIVKGLNRGIKHGLKAKRYNIPKVPKGHSVKPPTSSQSKKSKGTLKGKTQFESDTQSVRNVIQQGAKAIKGIYVNPVIKAGKKIKKYFTEK